MFMEQLRLSTGFHQLSEEAYHADPAITPSLSSGTLSRIVKGTLAEARWQHPRLNPLYEAEDRTAYDLGSVAHTLLLGKGAEIVIIDAADWRTKDAKEARDKALEAGKQPCLIGVYETAEVMVERAREQLAQDPTNRDAFNPKMGTPEQVAIAELDTPHGPVMCRTMMDWFQNVMPAGSPTYAAIYDYKTFQPGADPDGFVKYLFREARDVQDPFYTMVLAKLLHLSAREIAFRFVVQSPNPPYLLSVVELDDQAREFAFERARWGIHRWAEAMKTGNFEGYLPRTYYGAVPSYELHRWAEKMTAADFAAQLDARAEAFADEEEGIN